MEFIYKITYPCGLIEFWVATGYQNIKTEIARLENLHNQKLKIELI